jgi:hypothetical protein
MRSQVVRGYFQYHAVPTNFPRLAAFRYHVTVLWLRTLRRRSQKDWSQWDRIVRLAAAHLPTPRILHLWPNVRFAVKHPRWEPGARIAPAGICAGCALRRTGFSGLKWPPWQSLASSHVPSLAWAGGNTHCEA